VTFFVQGPHSKLGPGIIPEKCANLVLFADVFVVAVVAMVAVVVVGIDVVGENFIPALILIVLSR